MIFFYRLNFLGIDPWTFNFKKWATLKLSFYVSVCPQSAVRPSVRPLKTSTDIVPDIVPVLSDVRPGANTVGSILYNVYPLGQNTLGQILSGEVFMVGRSVGRRGVGRQRALSDGGRTEVFTSF